MTKQKGDRCPEQRTLTSNSIWQCKLSAGHEGEHSFVRIGWKQ